MDGQPVRFEVGTRYEYLGVCIKRNDATGRVTFKDRDGKKIVRKVRMTAWTRDGIEAVARRWYPDDLKDVYAHDIAEVRT